MKVPIESLKPGDLILPPERELSLWMRQAALDKGLPYEALYLTVIGSEEGPPDKGGRWWRIEAVSSRLWRDKWFCGGIEAVPWRFRARVGKLWPLIPASEPVTPDPISIGGV